MKKILITSLLVVAFFICGCEEEKIKEEEKVKNTEKIIEEEKTSNIIETKEESIVNTIEEKEQKEEIEDKKELETDENKIEVISEPIVEDKKVIVCTYSQSSDKYSANIKYTTTFEKDTISYHTTYIEKAFKEGYKAEEDGAFKDITNEYLDSLKDGRSGSIKIENNTIYYTLNVDVKNYPKMVEYVTTHTEYNDFFNHMINNNGYSCVKK